MYDARDERYGAKLEEAPRHLMVWQGRLIRGVKIRSALGFAYAGISASKTPKKPKKTK